MGGKHNLLGGGNERHIVCEPIDWTLRLAVSSCFRYASEFVSRRGWTPTAYPEKDSTLAFRKRTATYFTRISTPVGFLFSKDNVLKLTSSHNLMLNCTELVCHIRDYLRVVNICVCVS